MKAPKCKICGKEHYGPCNVFTYVQYGEDREFDSEAEMIAAVTGVQPSMANKPIENVANNVANTYKYRDPEKRRAYQRELMRKRRSK